MSLRLSLDTKPLGAFVEYAMKPLLEDMREILELLEKNGVKITELTDLAWRLFLLHHIMTFASSVAVATILCLTLLKLL